MYHLYKVKRKYVWYLWEFSSSSFHCVFWVPALFLYSLVSHTFRWKILFELTSVGQSRSQVVMWRCSERPTFIKLTFDNTLVSLACRSIRCSTKMIHKSLNLIARKSCKYLAHLRNRKKWETHKEKSGAIHPRTIRSIASFVALNMEPIYIVLQCWYVTTKQSKLVISGSVLPQESCWVGRGYSYPAIMIFYWWPNVEVHFSGWKHESFSLETAVTRKLLISWSLWTW